MEPKKTTKKGKLPRKGSKKSEGNGEEINPGLLLGDFVNGTPPPTKAPKVKRKGKKPSKISKKEEAEVDEMELGLDEDDETLDLQASERLLGAVSSLTEDREKSPERKVQAEPENEYHLPPVSEVTLEDLLAPLQGETRFSQEVKQLKALVEKEALPEPASEAKRGREEREALYKRTSRDIEKYFPQVHRMNRADQVDLEPELVVRESTKEMVSTFNAMDDFEKELEEITQAAGASEMDLKGAKVLPVNPNLRDAQQIRQVAKLKALMMREQQTKRRVNKIKSKTYRRIHRKSELRDREVMLERLELENPELAKQLKQDYERKHAEKRLLRARFARKKWTQTMQRFAKGDRNAQQEISKQAQKAHDEQQALRRAIQGKEAKDSDSEAVDLSDEDEDDTQTVKQSTVNKAKRLTVKEIQDLDAQGELPTTGLLGMKFMQQAIKQKREDAKKEAMDVLKELEGLEKDDYKDDDKEEEKEQAPDPSAQSAEKRFTPEELEKARQEVDAMLEQDDNFAGYSVAGPLTIHGVDEAAPAPVQQATPATSSRPSKRKAEKVEGKDESEENPWLAENPWVEDAQPNQTKEATSKAKRKKKKVKAKDEGIKDTELEMEANSDILAALNMDSAEAKEQRELVRTAFVEGSQIEDFEDEVETAEREKEEKNKEDSGELPGWGSWAGEGAPKPRRTPTAKAKAKEASKPKPSHFSVYDGKTEASKYFVDQLPYGMKNPAQYNQELRMPTGPEWNALPAHLQRIKPKFFSKVGTIVPPLQLVKHLPKESRAGVIETWASRKQPTRLKARI